jgi:hypothetical protein
MLKNLVLNLEPRTVFDHHPNLNNSFRLLLIGASGSGKTTLLFRMIIEPDFIDFQNVIIFTTTPKQQEYQLLYHGFTNGLSKTSIAALVLNQADFLDVPIPILCKEYSRTLGDKDNGVTITLSSNTNDIIHPDMLDKKRKHLIIFDDCVNDSNQVIMSQYFSRGRHSNCNCIYLSQSYFDLDRAIRLNSNFLILFKLSQRNKADIYNNVVSTIMEKHKFYTFVDNVWSKKYGYIVINRDDNLIYSDIFIEQKRPEEDLITDEYYPADEYMRQEKTAAENIREMADVLEQRALLKTKFQTHDLAQRGMYEQAAKLQEPTIKAIRDTQEVEKQSERREDVKQFPKLQNMYKNLHKNAAGSAYSLIQAKQTFYVNNLNEEFDVWKFNSSSRGNVGRFILFTHNSKEHIWNKTFDQPPLQLTPGLSEILFNNATNQAIIQSEDIKKWENLVIQAGLGSSYKSSKIYRDSLSHLVEEVVGEGLKEQCGCKGKTEIVVVPSKREDLINALNLQLQATETGHNDTFDYANALMKEMLRQKIMKSKDYREILRVYFHI